MKASQASTSVLNTHKNVMSVKEYTDL